MSLRPAFAVRLLSVYVICDRSDPWRGDSRAAFVAVLWAANFVQEGALLDAWLRFWIGDSVGVLVTAPLLLAAADSESRRQFMQVARRTKRGYRQSYCGDPVDHL